ncbi:MAG: hypothetical protein K9N09_01295 [Candidatus Cloacimonetes bacterium]|nr:hypothetical protein [Candidatus Cloacimonadota bacterium]MCF7812959.1 hypothetical protein [Candidatus Cloacimonadota bacterium]MCF7867309.1 hypothetical protein [Candidatus Cloacimonadota bacterium]MCF7882753.1 hypothetical protein [Candidatus Cloacimonadota bacterium]
MHFVFSGVFWGLVLVLLGLSMIIKIVFKIDLPIIRIVFAVILIYWGLKLLFGLSFSIKKDNDVVFNNADIEHVQAGKEYNVIFGKSNIDLRDFDLQNETAKVEINVIFGNGVIYLNPDIPARIKIDAVFAEAKLPKKTVSVFGDFIYDTPGYVEGEPYLLLNVDVVFGNAIIEY